MLMAGIAPSHTEVKGPRRRGAYRMLHQHMPLCPSIVRGRTKTIQVTKKAPETSKDLA